MKAFKKIKCSLKVLKKIKCPCCGYYTIEDYGEEVNCNICPVCFWQYDVVGQDNPNDIVGGPNGKLSLNQARDNYKKFGACSEDMVPYVRKPNAGEIDIENAGIK